MSGPTIFISYSHKDEKWKNRLVKHLGVLHNQGWLELWDDRQIVAGQEWSQEIQKAMDRASVAILLISAHSLTSRFILHEEVKCLLERRNKEGLPIFPVIVSPCDYGAVAWLHRMQLRPTDGRPLSRGRDHQIDFDLSEITKEVRSLLDSSMRPSQASHPIAPHNNGCIATETGTASIEITINRDFKSYSKDEQSKLLSAIADVLDITGDVRVIRKRPGSVKLTLELTPEQAERLLWAAKAGRFAEYGLIDAELIEKEPGPSDIESRQADDTDVPLSLERLEPGQILFNRYLIEKQLSEGGMGTVWLVRHLELDVPRALKLIISGIAFDPQARARFKREAQVMARLSHSNAVTVHDAGMAEGLAFIEMEYVRGQSLDKLLKPGVAMPLDWTARLLEQLCGVLQKAHALEIVHRDLKPSNLMLVEGQPAGRELLKVLDVGLAKILEGDHRDPEGPVSQPGMLLGTPPYMSPEQIIADPNRMDARSDLYSVGVILYELLTGWRPFGGPITSLLYAHLHTPPPSFAERNPSVIIRPEVERVVMRCLAKNPEDRPQTASELADEFRRGCQAGEPRPRPRWRRILGLN